MASIPDDRKSRGRPKVGATHVGVRIPPDQLQPLDAWIADQPDPKPSRPEAIREALSEHLKAKGYLPQPGGGNEAGNG